MKIKTAIVRLVVAFVCVLCSVFVVAAAVLYNLQLN